MSVVLTIRDVPEEIRDVLARDARERGQSLQAFLVSVLRQQAAFSRNREMLIEIEEELRTTGGAGTDAADVLDQVRAEREGPLQEGGPPRHDDMRGDGMREGGPAA